MANKFRQGENEFRRRLMCSIVSDHQVHGLLIDYFYIPLSFFSRIMIMSAIKFLLTKIIEIMILAWKVVLRKRAFWKQLYCSFIRGKSIKYTTHVCDDEKNLELILVIALGKKFACE
jgi:hypothetical protein